MTEKHKHSAHSHARAHNEGTGSDNEVVAGLLILTVLFASANAFLSFDANATFESAVGEISSPVPVVPPKVSIIRIVTALCSDCFDIDPVVELVKSQGLDVIKEREVLLSSSEGKALVSKYGIAKAPTVVVTGETNYSEDWLSFWKDFGDLKEDGAVVFNKQTPIYVDAVSGQQRGRVEAVFIGDESCSVCVNYEVVVDQLKQIGVKISGSRKMNYRDGEGAMFVEKYNITQVPTILLSDGLSEYPQVTQTWSSVGTVEEDGWYVLRQNSPPYRDVESDEVKGRVTLISLTDASCDKCYNVSIHKQVLANLGIVLVDEVEFDVGSDDGKSLVSKYDITVVPTIVLSEEASVYTTLMQVWGEVGTVEDDGTLVFRNVATALQGAVYKDLSTGTVVGLPSEGLESAVPAEGSAVEETVVVPSGEEEATSDS